MTNADRPVPTAATATRRTLAALGNAGLADADVHSRTGTYGPITTITLRSWHSPVDVVAALAHLGVEVKTGLGMVAVFWYNPAA